MWCFSTTFKIDRVPARPALNPLFPVVIAHVVSCSSFPSTMSAVRRSDRRATRNTLASPYARPSRGHPPKKSVRASVPRHALLALNRPSQSWSLSGLVSFLFGGDSEPEDSDTSGPSDGEIEQGPPPRRFSPPQPLPPPPPPPQQQACTRPPFLRVQDRSILI